MLQIINESTEKKQLIEVHNRPYLIDQISNETILPISLFLHNDPQTMKGSKSIRERENLSNKCAAIFCVSEYIRKQFLEGILNKKDNIHVLYNGINNMLKKISIEEQRDSFCWKVSS